MFSYYRGDGMPVEFDAFHYDAEATKFYKIIDNVRFHAFDCLHNSNSVPGEIISKVVTLDVYVFPDEPEDIIIEKFAKSLQRMLDDISSAGNKALIAYYGYFYHCYADNGRTNQIGMKFKYAAEPRY